MKFLREHFLPCKIIYPHAKNSRIPLKLSSTIHDYIGSPERRSQIENDLFGELDDARRQIDDDVVVKTDWQEHLAENCELQVFPNVMPYSSVGATGSVFSTELGLIAAPEYRYGVDLEKRIDEIKGAYVSNIYDFFNDLGCVTFRIGHYTAALNCFKRAADAKDHRCMIHFNVVVSMIKLGLAQEAVKYARDVQASGNNSLEAKLSLMIALSTIDEAASYQVERELVGADKTGTYDDTSSYFISSDWLDRNVMMKGMGSVPCELTAQVCYRAGDYRLARTLTHVEYLNSLT